MTAALFLHLLAAVALMGVLSRLFDARCDTGSSRLWSLAHVLIALGLLARLFRMEPEAAFFVTSGLALMYGARWARRSTDR